MKKGEYGLFKLLNISYKRKDGNKRRKKELDLWNMQEKE